MSFLTIALIIGLVIVALLALKFLVGLAKTVVTIGIFIFAAVLLVNLLTGQDFFGVSSTAMSVLGTFNQTVQNVVP